MKDFLLSPVLSLFSINFYRRMLGRSLSWGFLYLGYLSLLFSLWAFVLFSRFSVPAMGEFVSWLGKNLPKMILTPQGMQLEPNEPKLLTHPKYGAILYLNPTIDSPTTEDFSKALVIFTRTKAAYHNPRTGEVRMQSLVSAEGAQRKKIEITGDKLIRFWGRSKPWLGVVFFFSMFVGTYLWKLVAVLIYSLAGLVVNLFRRNRLSYGRLLQLTIFALTPMSLFQWFSWQFPAFHLHAGFLISFLVTTVYLGFILFATQEKPAEI